MQGKLGRGGGASSDRRWRSIRATSMRSSIWRWPSETRGQLDVAKETLLSALTIEPRNAAAHYNLAQSVRSDRMSRPAPWSTTASFSKTRAPSMRARAAAVRARIEPRCPGLPSDHVRD